RNGSEVDKNRQQHGQRYYVIQNLRSQINEVTYDDGSIDVVFHDIGQQLKQGHQDEKCDENDENEDEEKPESTKHIDIKQAEKLWMMRKGVGPLSKAFPRRGRLRAPVGKPPQRSGQDI